MQKKAHLTLRLNPNEKPQVAKGDRVVSGARLISSSSELSEFNLAKLMGISPKDIEKYLKVKFGEKVEKGQLLAQKSDLLSRKIIKSPLSGVFIQVDKSKGIVGIQKENRHTETTAWFEGVVEEVQDDKIVFSVKGEMISGSDGKGLPVTGKYKIIENSTALTMPIEISGCVLAVKDAQSDLIAKADALGAVAIVAETLDQPPFSLPYVLVSDINDTSRFREKSVIVFGDAKELIVIED
jgi:predicted transcriptional regulator